MAKNIREYFTTGWLGNVTSGTASSIIFGLITFFGLLVWNWISPDTIRASAKSIWAFLKLILGYQVSIGLILLSGAIFYFLIFAISKARSKPKPDINKHEIWEKAIGDYTFKKLHNIFRGEFIPNSSSGETNNTITENAIVYFFKYIDNFGIGLSPDTINDNGFAYNKLGPRLVTYGLVDKEKRTFRLNEKGRLFHSCLAIIFNDHPEHKTQVFKERLSYIPSTPSVTYSAEEIERFDIEHIRPKSRLSNSTQY